MSKFEPFALILNRQKKIEEETETKFGEDCKVIEEGLVFSESAALYIMTKKIELDNKQSNLWGFFHRNFFYLLSAYQQIKKGLLHPADSSIRVVIETIFMGYAFICKDEIWSHYYIMNQLDSKKFESKKNKQIWNDDNENKLVEMRKKYTILKILPEIYTPSLQKKIESDMYWLLSHQSHPSIFGLNFNAPDLRRDDDFTIIEGEIKDRLKIIVYLCSANLAFFLEIFSDVLNKQERKRIFEQLSILNKYLGFIPNLIPDKSEHQTKLKIKCPTDTIEGIEDI